MQALFCGRRGFLGGGRIQDRGSAAGNRRSGHRQQAKSGVAMETACSLARLMRTLTSPRSNSNSAMSFSIKNSISSFSSFDSSLAVGLRLLPPGSLRRRRSLRLRNRYQFFASGRQNLAPLFSNHYHVFDANTPDSGRCALQGSIVITMPACKTSLCPAPRRGAS